MNYMMQFWVGKLEDAVKVTKIAVEEGMTPHEIINQYMIKAMEEIGSRFEAGKVFVPNLLMSALPCVVLWMS